MPILLFFIGVIAYFYLEISLLVSVGGAIGVLPMILLLIVISFVGLWFVKLRGLYTLYSIRQQLAHGQIPTDALVSSVLFVLAGILLIVPGFLSDILAMLCVLPFSRHWLQNYLMCTFKSRIKIRRFSAFGQESNTFEAEFTRRHDKDKWIK